ncbi:MAG: alpha/beta hydrolase [Chitinophagaceae bacterium]|nr:alpha/beta hydrolase [Chitinophagaceae bacterium]
MRIVFLILGLMMGLGVWAQEDADTIAIPGAVITRNIRYAGAGVRQDFDLYRPAGKLGRLPLVIWIHGGGWWMGGKKNMDVVAYLIGHGYAIASVGYRYSQDSIFPAQIRDCYAAVGYIFKHAAELGVDTARIVVAGASAGGHLASLLGMSLNNVRQDFGSDRLRGMKVSIKGVINFYGPADLYAFHGDGAGYKVDSATSSVARMLGASPLVRPDLAKWASPATYVDRGDPPVLILHGDKDPIIPYYLGPLFYNVLRLAGVKASLVTIAGGGHGGPEFSDAVRQARVLEFLREVLR